MKRPLCGGELPAQNTLGQNDLSIHATIVTFTTFSSLRGFVRQLA